MIEFNREGIPLCPDCGRPATDPRGCKNCIHNPYRVENPFEPEDRPGSKRDEKLDVTHLRRSSQRGCRKQKGEQKEGDQKKEQLEEGNQNQKRTTRKSQKSKEINISRK